MVALVVVEARPKSPEKLAQYSAAAASTLANFGGEFVHRGKFVEALGGTATPHGLGIIRFESADAARRWYGSAEYQAIIPLREEAADMSFKLYDLVG